MRLNQGIFLFLFLFGNLAMSLAGERNELRSARVKLPSLRDLIQRRLDQRQGKNSAYERQTKLTRDMVQRLLQNTNRFKRGCTEWWCGRDRAAFTTTLQPTTTPKTSSFRALINKVIGWFG